MLVFRRQYSIGLEDLKDGGKAVTIGVDEFVRWRDVRAGEMSGREPTFYLVFFRVSGYACGAGAGNETRGPSTARLRRFAQDDPFGSVSYAISLRAGSTD
jgi:hypothetical protein